MQSLASCFRTSIKFASPSLARMNSVHSRSTFDTGGASGLYDRARPSYPANAVEKIFKACSTTSDIHVVEMGPGSGIFSRLLLARPNVAKLTALEPSKGMRQGFQTAVIDALPQFASRISLGEGTFTSAPTVSDHSADLLCIAQAFHWIGDQPEQFEAALTEFARILQPGAILALIWNLEDRSVPWVASIRDLYEKYEADSPQYRHGFWKGIFKTKAYENLFVSPKDGSKPGFEEWHTSRNIETTRQGVVDRVMSKSYIQVLSPAEQEALTKEIHAILDQGQGIEYIDKSKGVFKYPYQTDLFLLRRTK